MEYKLGEEKHTCKFWKTCKTLDTRYPPTMKFSKFRRKFAEFILISEKNCRSCFAPIGTAGYIFEKERQLNQYSYMIHPYSEFRHVWESLVLLETLISLLVRLFIVSQLGIDAYFSFQYQIFAFCLDMFEMIDIILGFVTGYVDRETKDVIMETRQVFLHNLQKFWFYLGFVSALPLDIVIYLLKNIAIDFPIFRYFIFIKIFRLIRTFPYLVHLAKIYKWSELVYRLVFTAYNLLLILNWLSSLFYMVIFLDDFGPSNNKFENNGPFSRHLTIFHMVSSILFLNNGLLSYLNITTGKDMFFSSFLLLVTSILQAISFGFFIQLYCFEKTSLICYREMLQETQKFVTQENLPKQIHLKIIKYFEFRFRGRYFREKTILETISPPLRKEIANFLCRSLLLNPESIFKGVPDELVSDLCLYMKYEIFLAGDDVIREGKKGTKIYFINCGSFSVYSAKGTEIQHLYNGAQFGESAFASRNLHPVTVLALEMSECYSLKYGDFIACAAAYPDYVAAVTKAANDKRKSVKDFSEVFKKK